VLRVSIEHDGDRPIVRMAGARSPLEGGPYPGGVTEAAVRPDWVSLGGSLEATCRSVWYRGPHSDVVLDTPGGRLLLQVPGRPGLRPGEPVGWSLRRLWPLAEEPVSPAPGHPA